jgi:hypothetical protein
MTIRPKIAQFLHAVDIMYVVEPFLSTNLASGAMSPTGANSFEKNLVLAEA